MARSWYLFHLVSWALFAQFARYRDVNVWKVHSTMLAILSLWWRLQCLSLPSLGAPNFLSTCQVTTLLVLSTWETMALHNNRLETCKTWWAGTSLLGSRPVLWGLVPSSCAEVAGMWIWFCNISVGYATFWSCEWRALRRIVSGCFWLACSLDGRHGKCVTQPTGHRWHSTAWAWRWPPEPFSSSSSMLSFLWAQVRKFMLFSSWVYRLTKAHSQMWMLFQWLHESWQAEGELHLSSLRCICCRYHVSGCITVCKSISSADDR